jgi:hypothetical protein
VARNSHYAHTIRHDDMFALAHDAKAGLLQGSDGIQVVTPGIFGTAKRPLSLRARHSP